MPDVRASDADRDRTVAVLRELAELQSDLPAAALHPAPQRPSSHRPMLPGRWGFTVRWHSPVRAEVASADLLAHITAPLLLTSPFLLARAWPALRESGDGRFVAVASVHGLVASPFKSAYVSAKHGLLGLVKTLALEGADQGVTAAAVCPGYVRTPLVENQVTAQAQAHGMPEERVLEEVILAPHAVKRLIEPDEVADVVAFLLGPTGRAFTGAAVSMDQGWTAR